MLFLHEEIAQITANKDVFRTFLMNRYLLKQTINCSSCSSLMVLLSCAASKSLDIRSPLTVACKKSGIARSTFYSKRFIIEIMEADESTFTDLAVQEKISQQAVQTNIRQLNAHLSRNFTLILENTASICPDL